VALKKSLNKRHRWHMCRWTSPGENRAIKEGGRDEPSRKRSSTSSATETQHSIVSASVRGNTWLTDWIWSRC